MRYTKETVDEIVDQYNAGKTVEEIASAYDVPPRSVIAKLSSLGVYRKKTYVNKNGEAPVKKEVYIERIAELLNANIELLDSLEKVNKRVLVMIANALEN
jgi:transposase-like protein